MTEVEGPSPVPPGDELWQAIAVGYCEWENGDWPDDRDIDDARPAAQHIANYVRSWMVRASDNLARTEGTFTRAESAPLDALRKIAYFEPQTDENAEAMRQIARSGLRKPVTEEPDEDPTAWGGA